MVVPRTNSTATGSPLVPIALKKQFSMSSSSSRGGTTPVRNRSPSPQRSLINLQAMRQLRKPTPTIIAMTSNNNNAATTASSTLSSSSLISNNNNNSRIKAARCLTRTLLSSVLLILIVYVLVSAKALFHIFHLERQEATELSSLSAAAAGGVPVVSSNKLIRRSPSLQQQQGGATPNVNNINKDTDQQQRKSSTSTEEETLVISTQIGDLHIVLRSDLSPESVEYIQQLAATAPTATCHNCRFYRAEKPGILQGNLDGQPQIPLATVKGRCPMGSETVANDCPAWDAQCGCHGPVMTRGMVAWAAGATGPDFFIDAYQRPATWWGTQHTVWGQVRDPASLALVDAILQLPSSPGAGGLTFLTDVIHFESLRRIGGSTLSSSPG